MNWKKQPLARKELELLLAEAAGEHRLHRVPYFSSSRRHSLLTQHLLHEMCMPPDEQTGMDYFNPEGTGFARDALENK